jgi:hypothetical protein
MFFWGPFSLYHNLEDGWHMSHEDLCRPDLHSVLAVSTAVSTIDRLLQMQPRLENGDSFRESARSTSL